MCWAGHHIWDEKYDEEVKSERWCVCCEHFFASDASEMSSMDDAIEFPGQITNPVKPSEKKPGKGMSKGIIKRRS